MKIIPKQGPSGKWYVLLRARNGKTWSTAETYSKKSNAVRAAKSMALDMAWGVEVAAPVERKRPH